MTESTAPLYTWQQQRRTLLGVITGFKKSQNSCVFFIQIETARTSRKNKDNTCYNHSKLFTS
jgi:hypothetical protein